MQFIILGLQGSTNIDKVTAATLRMGIADTAAALVKTKLTEAQQQKILMDKGLTLEEAKTALATASHAAANTAATATTGGLTAATGALTTSLKGLWAAMMSNPLTAIITVATTVIPLIIGIVNWISEAEEEARQAAREAADAFESQKQTISNTKKELDDLITKYEKLSKGVDGLNQNVSLSNDEYADYLDVCNRIGEMFPSLIQGYDDQGNAILTLKGNVEGLTEAYNNMIIAANSALLLEGKTLFKDFKNQAKDLKYSDGMTIGISQNLERILNSDNLDKAINSYAGIGTSSAKQIVQALKDIGIEQNQGESSHDFIKRAIQENKSLVEAIVNDWNAKAEEAATNMISVSEAYISNSILNGDHKNITSNMQGVINSLVSSFDYEFFDQFDNVYELYTYLSGLLKNFDDLSSNEINTIELAFNAKTELNNGNCSVGEYISRLNDIETAIGGFDEDTQAQIRLLLNDDDVKNKLDTLTFLRDDELASWFNGLSKNELEIAYEIFFEVDGATAYGLDEWKNAVSNYKIPIDVEVNFVDIMADKEFTDAIDTYLEKVNELREAQSNYENGVFDTDSDKWWEFAQKYPELAADYDNLNEAIENQIQELTGYTAVLGVTGEVVTEASGIMAVLEDAFNKVDTEEGRQQIQAIMDKLLEANQVIGSTSFDVFGNLNDEYTALEKSVSSLVEAYEALNNGETLSKKNIVELLAKYPELIEYYDTENDALNLQASTIEDLFELQKAQSVARLKQLREEYRLSYDVVQATEAMEKAYESLSLMTVTLDVMRYQGQDVESSGLWAAYQEAQERYNEWRQEIDNYNNRDAEYGKAIDLLEGATLGDFMSSSGSSNSSKSSNSDKPKVFDWIKIAIDRVSEAFDRLKKIATNTFNSLKTRSRATYKEISAINKEIALQQKAYERYMQQANSVGLSADLMQKVQDGSVDISEYDSEVAELISDYQNWYIYATLYSNVY